MMGPIFLTRRTRSVIWSELSPVRLLILQPTFGAAIEKIRSICFCQMAASRVLYLADISLRMALCLADTSRQTVFCLASFAVKAFKIDHSFMFGIDRGSEKSCERWS